MMRLLSIIFVLLLSACQESDSVKPPKADGEGSNAGWEPHFPAEMVVVTRNAPTTWYQGREEAEGPEYDLIRSFADFHSIQFRIEIVDSIGEVLQWISEGKAHIAAAGLTDTEERRELGFIFGPEYYQVQQQVVCRRDHGRLPRKVADLVGKNIQVIADSSYVERLNELQQEHPELQWQEVEDTSTEQLMEQLWQKEIDCILADSNIVSINRRYFPELLVAFPISEQQSLAWVINEEWEHLVGDIEEWLEQKRGSGELAVIHEKYYGHVELFDYVDMRQFIRRINQRLPKYMDDFKSAAEEHEMDWILLAAQSYQESHWNPRAKSPTGVRGLMMLTLRTARQLGVESRLDPQQSIRGGAKYLAQLQKRVPESVEGEDRLWFALAAYNVGFGHLLDARKLARKLGKNPDFWVEMKEVLPLLSQKKYYKDLKYGYARGSEPVRYVQRVREYQQVLQQQFSVPQD